MNNICKVVWSHARQQFVVVSEIVSSAAKTHSRRTRSAASAATSTTARPALRAVALACSACLSVGWAQHAHAQALPQGGQVVAGQGSIQTAGSVMTINQSTAKLAVDWQSFSIGQGKTVEFVQPSASAVALNRVLGTDVSVIQGALKANGQVFLVNPNGVLFTPTAQVNVGGIVASTLNISTDDFMTGNYRFEGTSSNAIVNQGNITAASGGTVALIAAKIANTGQINAEAGNVLMGAGSRVKLDLGGPVKIEVEQGAIDALIEQGGGIRADGGLVYLTAKAVGELTTTVINHTGITEARTLATGEKGQIVLLGGMDKDRIVVGGKLDATAPNGGDGGFIETSAAKVSFANDLQVTTAATAGKTGEWLIDPTDFTIANSGGDMPATLLSSNLGSGNVTIQSTSGTSGTNGDIFVNDAVTWSTNKLTLEAKGNININANLNAQTNASLDMKAGYSTPGTAGGTYDSTKSVLVGMDANGSFKGKVSFFSDAGSTPGGTGSLDINGFSYYIITALGSAADSGTPGVFTLQGLASAVNTNGRKFALGADIDAASTSTWNSSTGFTRIPGLTSSGTSTAIFDGLGHVISNLTINKAGYSNVGLFAGNNGGSIIQNVGLLNANITGADSAGALVGRNKGTVRNSYSTGFATGTSSVGGLVGMNMDEGTAQAAIIGSHSDATVTGTSKVGGLVGANYAYTAGKGIVNSYATGAVTASSDNVGGLVGYGGPFDSGYWGVVTNSYYNLDSVVTKIGTGASAVVVPVTPYGLYGSQYTAWFNGGALTPLSIANYTSLVSSGGNNYTISSIQGMKDLLGFADKSQYTFTLSANLNLASEPGFYVPLLKANFNGAGHTISNLNLNFNNSVLGMFGEIWGSISNLGLVNASVTGQDYIGGLTGFGDYGSSISNSYAQGAVVGRQYAGGLIGVSNGDITGSHSTATVTASGTGYYNFGGLVGGAWDGTISNSYATGDVTTASGNYSVGGLAGYSYAVTSNSYATGNVTAPNSFYVGGLVVDNNRSLSSSYATGQVTALGGTYVGGLVGYNENTILNSYAMGAVSADDHVGGLAGTSHSWGNTTSIDKSYSTGAVTGTGTSVGGFLGSNDNTTGATLSKNFYDQVGSGKTVGVGNASDASGVVEGKTTAQLKDIATFTNAGWSIATDSNITLDYPRLNTSGSGTVWLIKPSAPTQTTLTYTLGSSSQNYAGSSYNLSDYWSSSAIFGASGSSLLAGTDYTFSYGGSPVTGFSNVGTYSGIGVALTTAGAAHYALATTGNTAGSFTISPAPLTITANAASKTYNGSAYSGGNGVSISGLVGGESSAVLSGAITYAGTSQGAKNAGSYTITPQGLSSGNYAISYVDGTLTVAKAPLTVTADNQSKVYGSADPALTYQITSGALVSGDALSGALTRTAGNNAGSYTIDASALANSNYQITAHNGTLTVSPRPITVTADNQGKVYGSADPALTYQVTSGALVSGDSLSGALTRTAGSNVGSYTINASALANGNYLITARNGTLTISPRPITVTADDLSKVYGNADPALTWQVTSGSLVSGDALSGALSRSAGETVGTYTVDASALANGNYLITAHNGVLTIKPSSAGAIATVQGQAVSAAAPQTAPAAVGNGALVSVGSFAAANTTADATTVASTVQSGGLLLQTGEETDEASGSTGSSDTADSSNKRRKASASQKPTDTGRDPSGFMRVFVVRGGVNTNFAQVVGTR